jgi:hypothetical protein
MLSPSRVQQVPDNRDAYTGIGQLPAHDRHQAQPEKRNMSPVMPYWTPMTLWSVEKIYFCQKPGSSWCEA